MGRLTELFHVIQLEKMPSYHDSKVLFSYIDLTNSKFRSEVKQLRKKYRKMMKEENEE